MREELQDAAGTKGEMKSDPPRNKKALRRYADLAYEQGQALTDLAAQFDARRIGALSAFELAELMHRFHNGAAVNRTTGTIPPHLRLVAAAIARGPLSRDEVEAEVPDAVSEEIAYFASQLWPAMPDPKQPLYRMRPVCGFLTH